jgi:hypothetical protein
MRPSGSIHCTKKAEKVFDSEQEADMKGQILSNLKLFGFGIGFV